ncbi:MAG: hypothetical protein A2X49_04170 [Lentisphaerae bacterium GWF2_52_8]|nr:MAG: hypothetical protein A2X49_04170 [Lentisphaerae bacterium GWF2_52_8]
MNRRIKTLKNRELLAGISFRRGPAQWQKALASCTGMEGLFSCAELPPSALEQDKLKTALSKAPWVDSWHLADSISASLSRSAAEQSPKIVAEFKAHFYHHMIRAVEAGASSLHLDLGLEMAEREPRLLESRIALLKSLAAALHGRGIVLCLPLRLPSNSPGASDFALRCLRAAGHPAVRLAVDFYPHELPRIRPVAELLRAVRFDAEIVRICYEPELGNHLTLPLLGPCLDYWSKNLCRGSVLFAPATSDQDRFHSEAASIASIFSEWRNSLPGKSSMERMEKNVEAGS